MSSIIERRIERLEQGLFGSADDPLWLNTLTFEEGRYLMAELRLTMSDTSPAEREEAEQTIARLAGSIRESHLCAIIDHAADYFRAKGIG